MGRLPPVGRLYHVVNRKTHYDHGKTKTRAIRKAPGLIFCAKSPALFPRRRLGSSRQGRSPGFRRPLPAFPVLNDQWLSARGPDVDHSGGATPDSHRLPYSPDWTNCPSGTSDAGATNIGVTDCFSKCFLEEHPPDLRDLESNSFKGIVPYMTVPYIAPSNCSEQNVENISRSSNFGVNGHILKVAHNLTYRLGEYHLAHRTQSVPRWSRGRTR